MATLIKVNKLESSRRPRNRVGFSEALQHVPKPRIAGIFDTNVDAGTSAMQKHAKDEPIQRVSFANPKTI